jgi:hypothetical protein
MFLLHDLSCQIRNLDMGLKHDIKICKLGVLRGI